MILLVEYRLHTRPKMRKAPLSLSYLVVLPSSPNNQQCAKKLQKIVQHYLGCFPAILQKTVPDMQSVPLVMLVSLTNLIYHKSNKYTYIFNMEMKCTIFCTLYSFHRPIVLPT